MHKSTKIIIGIIAGAVLIVGLIVSISAKQFSNQGKYVEVKGLSERIVKSDRAIWPINFEVKSNNSTDLFNQIEKNIADVKEFLRDAGFEDSEISVAPVDTYQDTYQGAQYRYNARVSMSVFTNKVDLVRSTSQSTLGLVQKGIVMNGSYINFEFSDLNSIKPEMLAEAIKNARESAEQFADNSGARIGDLARANQGVFSITDKDPGSPEYKKVRVVSTLRYLLN